MAIPTLHNSTISKICSLCKLHHYILKRAASTSRQQPQAVFLEKTIENPVIVIPDKKKVDLIGPPNRVSNLRPVIRQRTLHETQLQQRLRKFQDETQEWNEKFWTKHNTKFIKEREEYIKAHLKRTEDKQTLTADEMSEFYKAFLDRNWKTHLNYNFEWYKRNFAILFLAFRANLENYSQKL